MTKEEIKFEKRKANLIIDCLYEGMFESVYNEIQSEKYQTLDAVDIYVGEQLKQYDIAVNQVKDFYMARFGCDGSTLDEEEIDEDAE